MKTVRGPELDALLGIDGDVVPQLRRMHEGGSTPAELVHFLAGRGVPKPGATIALRRANVMAGNEAKRAVHSSPHYAHRKDADESFYEAVATFAQQDENKATAA